MAMSLRKVEETAPALVSLYKQAGESLRRHGIDGQRVAVHLVVDYSGSMKPYYASGAVQALADRVLGLSAQLDEAGGGARRGVSALKHRRPRLTARARPPPREPDRA
ncbi:VWA domain-containing protein, partial [Streptomyces sp. NPDC059556]|uniref:VWA domain-containing protein n=1 Tax=Streptomyces sp. NPDC059556 TaxID=3346863 RepID=UPI0036987210